ncbi:hypothetical protein [Candidatus Tisiphia endosymbiont of Oplodontha viridula]|uniref:hypothetical protein n=1 Tax=Candidatus Tisiphia endosymbiont of Oplodontha viridula TaxID=3077925 RepID=UPI0035C9254C
MPLLYLKAIKEAATDERNDILSKCQNSSELLQIEKLFSINHAVSNPNSIITQFGFIMREDVVVFVGEASDNSLYHETSV